MRKSLETGPDINQRLLQTFAMGTANYWLAFIADTATALFFLTWQLSHGAGPLLAGACFAGGYLLWGLTEYAFHRWVYHQPRGIFGEGHRIHHIKAETLIAMPWFITTATMFALWYAIAVRGGVTGFAGLASGWLLGFVWYSLVHHSHHHWNMRGGWARRLKAYHRVHHQFPDRNYGVTMRFWDTVFGTRYRRPAESAPHAEERATSLAMAAGESDFRE